jgi:hypothetical protein
VAEKPGFATTSSQIALYVGAAVLWPLWCEVFVAIAGLTQSLLERFGAGVAEATGIGLGIVTCAIASWWLGRVLGDRIPRAVVAIPIAWLVAAGAVALFGFGIADVRQVLGLIGVLGPFLFGAIGFVVGIGRGPREATV